MSNKKEIDWMVRYMTEEGFGPRHLRAIKTIIGLMNENEESEQEILSFAERLKDKYLGTKKNKPTGPDSNVKIVSDGTPAGTKVLVDGVPMDFVERVDIDPILPDRFLSATIKVNSQYLELEMQKKWVNGDLPEAPDKKESGSEPSVWKRKNELSDVMVHILNSAVSVDHFGILISNEIIAEDLRIVPYLGYLLGRGLVEVDPDNYKRYTLTELGLLAIGFVKSDPVQTC